MPGPADRTAFAGLAAGLLDWARREPGRRGPATPAHRPLPGPLGRPAASVNKGPFLGRKR